MRNLLRDLGNLPDKARTGINLIVGGLAILAVRYVGPLVGWASFQRTSAVVYHADAVLHRYSLARRAVPEDLSDHLVGAALLCVVSGAFFFCSERFLVVGGAAPCPGNC